MPALPPTRRPSWRRWKYERRNLDCLDRLGQNLYCIALEAYGEINTISKWGGDCLEDTLKKDGLSFTLLEKLSYRSDLGIRLKKNLYYFDREILFRELIKVNRWYDTCELLRGLVIDYRIKSIQSAILKYERYYPDHQAAKVFNDMLGFRTLCDNYDEVKRAAGCDNVRIADMSGGKARDDGYRGVHVYFQLSSFHYPIEIQYNTYYDRQMNNWLHKYVYKRGYKEEAGCALRMAYENAEIKNEKEFKEVLKSVLSGSKEI